MADNQNDSGVKQVMTRDVPAWTVSLGLHLVVIIILSTWTMATGALSLDTSITSVVDELDELDYKFDATVMDAVGNGSEANTLSSSMAAAEVINKSPQQEMRRELDEQFQIPEAAPSSDIQAPPEADLTSHVETSGTSEKVGGVEGSLDRMTYEIMNSLKERPTLAVWLFDESGSLATRREQLADRFEVIYGQLDSMKAEKNSPLKTAIVGFGENIHFYTPEPTSDISRCVNLVKGIKNDESGKEMVFTAVGQILGKWSRKYRAPADRHNCMIIIVTDERGDDFVDPKNPGRFEEAMSLVSKSGFRVFCIGNASPFGREKGYVRYTWSDGYAEDIPVDQGPESVQMETLDIPFWGARGVDSGRISSGLGPYGLTRLCAETGGLYLISEGGIGREFDLGVMKDYMPDYRPTRFYQKEVSLNLAKSKLVEAAASTRTAAINAPATSFRADTDNALREAATEAQRPAAIIELRATELVKILEAGEKDRAKIKEPRWQAAYDLAYGRALALQSRAMGYNLMLASMKSSPKSFTRQGNNTWVMDGSGEISTGPAVRKVATKATEHLTRVVDAHPGTPWAYLAELELERQMGWAWREVSTNYAPAGQMNGPDPKNRVLFVEEEDPKTGKKKSVPRERPKL